MKKGISLIVLVITIIVMIIIAATVVISLSNTGIIDRADQAVQLTNEKQVQDFAAMVWAEKYMDEYRGEDLTREVLEELEAEGITADDWNITITDSGITVKNKVVSAKEISFTIDGTSYKALEGMTWVDWLVSSYNTAEATITSDNIYIGGKRVIKSSADETLELGTNVIVSGNAYGLKSTGGTSDQHGGGAG